MTLHLILLLAALAAASSATDTPHQPAVPADYGQPHPEAPAELRQFAFLVGAWDCSGVVLAEDGVFEPFRATMVGRYILDGLAIEDVYRQYDSGGELQHFGATYRSYDTDGKRWVMKFHDALASTWLDLGPVDLGGVEVSKEKISFQHRLEPGGLIRVTFSQISATGFAWQAELSGDGGANWRQVMTLRARPAGSGGG